MIGPHADPLNAEARNRAGFGHQRIRQVWEGDVYEVSALGAPSLADIPVSAPRPA